MQDPVARVAFGLFSMLRGCKIFALMPSSAWMCAGLQNEYTRIQGPHAHQTQSGVSCHGQSVNSMFANVCSYHLELHASSCGRILDGHLSPARLGIAYRKVSWRELGLKPSHSWLRSIALWQFLTCNLWSFIVFFVHFLTHGRRYPPCRAQPN